MTPDPAVAAVRLAVRRELADVRPADHAGPQPVIQPVLVACSGGADSLALLAATVFEGRGRWHVVGVTVDHGLQTGSADHAARVVAQMAALGAGETVAVKVSVQSAGHGPEAAARKARYAVLGEAAARFGAAVVLLGHTLDDQAETVLLGLARGSGSRALSGMRRRFECYRRPLLDLTRAQTEAACRAKGIEVWADPHNEDPRFTRSRVRHRVLPVLEAELGPGVAASLARTADQLREDAEALDDLADRAWPEVQGRAAGSLDASRLAGLPDAVRRRLLRQASLAAGAPAAELFRVHVLAVDQLVTAWRGQAHVDLPGHLRVLRDDGELRFVPGAPTV